LTGGYSTATIRADTRRSRTSEEDGVKRKNIVFAILVVLLFTIGAMSLAAAGAKEGKGAKYTIGFSIAGAEEYWVAVQRGANEAAKKYGVELIYQNAEGDVAKQVTHVEDFVSRGVNLVIITPADAEGSKAAVDVARKAKVPIMALVNTVGLTYGELYPGLIAFIGQDEKATGAICGKMALEVLGAKGGNVLIIEGRAGTTPQIYRTQGFVDTVKANPNIKIIGKQAADWDAEKARRVMEDYLQRAEKIDFVFTHFDGMSLGAYQAIEAAGLAGRITVVGIDGTVAGLQAVRDGKMYGTTWISPVQQGYLGVETAAKYLNKQPIEKWVWINQIRVDKSNVDKIKPEF
jgi:ABC-type sugar transport system substrate-binding protein